jgi:hypothetical protein
MTHLIDGTAYVRPAQGEALHAAFLLAGVMRTLVTELEAVAADIDCAAVASAVQGLRQDVDWLGTVLVHERREAA